MIVKFRARLEKGKHDSVRILNRIVTVTDEGLEYEADQRHAELIEREMNIQANSKSVTTPGVKEEESDGKEKDFDTRTFRSVAARGNYLAQDRPDVQYAAKEISRFMSNPEEKDWRKAKRMARYPKGEGRMVMK